MPVSTGIGSYNNPFTTNWAVVLWWRSRIIVINESANPIYWMARPCHTYALRKSSNTIALGSRSDSGALLYLTGPLHEFTTRDNSQRLHDQLTLLLSWVIVCLLITGRGMLQFIWLRWKASYWRNSRNTRHLWSHNWTLGSAAYEAITVENPVARNSTSIVRNTEYDTRRVIHTRPSRTILQKSTNQLLAEMARLMLYYLAFANRMTMTNRSSLFWNESIVRKIAASGIIC